MFQSISKILSFWLLVCIFASTAHAQNQQWECAVNLQQGDMGVMSLERENNKLRGTISIVRNDIEFESELNGNWNGNEINLTRLLDANSNEPMAGIVIPLGTKKINIGGRFSKEYQGVWSADCTLVAGLSSNINDNNSETSNDAGSEGNTPAIPSVTSRVSPNAPSGSDKINFSARASHPDGIVSIDFFVDDKKVHTCTKDNCSFETGPLKSGNHTWYALATSESGTSNAKRAKRLTVKSVKSSTCTVLGSATGPSANLSLSYRVVLLGLDGQNAYSASAEFNDLKYRFEDVPKGDYTISVDTLTDSSVLWAPTTAVVRCGSQTELRQNFDFR